MIKLRCSTVAFANIILSLILTPGPTVTPGPMLTFGPSYNQFLLILIITKNIEQFYHSRRMNVGGWIDVHIRNDRASPFSTRRVQSVRMF